MARAFHDEEQQDHPNRSIMIDAEEPGFKRFEFSLEKALHLRSMGVELDNRADLGRQLRKNLRFRPPDHEGGTKPS